MQDVGLSQLSDIYPAVKDLHVPISEGSIPVPLTCVYGTGVSTDAAYKYHTSELVAASAPEPESRTTTDGDGTVNKRSLSVRLLPSHRDARSLAHAIYHDMHCRSAEAAICLLTLAAAGNVHGLFAVPQPWPLVVLSPQLTSRRCRHRVR